MEGIVNKTPFGPHRPVLRRTGPCVHAHYGLSSSSEPVQKLSEQQTRALRESSRTGTGGRPARGHACPARFCPPSLRTNGCCAARAPPRRPNRIPPLRRTPRSKLLGMWGSGTARFPHPHPAPSPSSTAGSGGGAAYLVRSEPAPNSGGSAGSRSGGGGSGGCSCCGGCCCRG